MRYVSHIRLSVTATFAVVMLLVLVFGMQLTLAQDPEVEGPVLPEPDLEDAPGDIGYGTEPPAVRGEQEDCVIDPADARCPPPAPHSIATPVVSFPSSFANLRAPYTRILWHGSPHHAYIFELHRSTTATGTYQSYRRIWERDRQVDFFAVARGYYYKIRAKRCRVWLSQSDCGDWGRFSSSVYVPRIATALGLSRSKRQMTATYTAAGRSWDEIEIASRTIGSTGNGIGVESDINGSGHNWSGTRGNEYRYRIKRCTTSTRSGCDRWSGWSPWVPVPHLPSRATNLELERAITQLTLKFKANGAGYNRAEIEERTTGRNPQTSEETEDLGDKKSHTISGTRSNEYRFRVVRCTDSAYEDCRGWTGWTAWKLVPKIPDDASGLGLTRSKTDLTATYSAEGASYDVVNIYGRPTPKYNFTVYLASNAASSRSYTKSVDRGKEYRFQVKRCTDSSHSDCGDWVAWTEAWREVPQLPSDPPKPDLGRVTNNLTVSYTASDSSKDKYDIRYPGAMAGSFVLDRTGTKDLDDFTRNLSYSARVYRCTDDARVDCTEPSDWSEPLLVPSLPAPVTGKPTLRRVRTDLKVTYTASGSSYDKYEIERAGTSTGTFSGYRDGTANNRKLKGVPRNYHYQVKLSRCTDEELTDCISASAWSNTLLVPNLPSSPGKPTITVSDDDLTVTYTPTDASYDQFQFKQSNLETTGFTSYTGGTLSGNVLSDVETGKWYQASVKRCTDSKHTDCRSWSQYSDAKYVAPAQVQATPTIGSGADGKSVIASFTLLSDFTYTLQLYWSEDEKRWYATGIDAVTPSVGETVYRYKGLVNEHYRAELTACKSEACVTYRSNTITLSKAPAPNISRITLANEDDLTVGYTLPTWNYGSGDVLDFEIKREESSSGMFDTDYTHATTPPGMPHKFNDVHTGYYYKARARRCSDSALTICGDWSGLSSAVNVPALSALLPPSNIRVSIVSHKEIQASFVRSTRPSQTTHRYVFEVGKSASQTGSFTYSGGINVETATKVSFSGLDADKWYKVRGKRCDDPARKRCGSWTESTNAVETVSPDPKIEYGGFSTSITIGEWLSKSIIVTAKGLDLTKTYKIKFRTATGTNSAAGVLKFAACDASTKPDGHDADVRTGSDTTGPLSLKVFGCEPGTDTLTVTLVEGVSVKSTVRLSVTVTPIPVPMDLRANGHSPGTVGQIELQWTAGAGVTKHEYQYADGLDDDGEPLADGDLGWSTEQELPSTRIITGRTLNKLYAVRLRSVRNGGVSAWSDKVYAFPTKKPLVINGIDYPAVADIRLRAFRTNRTFSYVFCANTITVPTGRPIEATALRTNWVADIKAGADSWAAAVKWRAPGSTGGDAYVRITGTVDDNCDLTKVPRKITRPEIRIARTKQELANACGFGLVEACIPGYPPPRDGGELGAFAATAPYIFFSGTPKYPWNPGSSDVKKGASTCSNVTHIAAHEFAHALGIGHRLWNQNDTDPSDDDSEDPTASITSSPAKYDYCGPQPLDIVAAMALYQSR